MLYGENEWENNTLKEKTCLKGTQRLDGKMHKLVHAHVFMCFVFMCVTAYLFIEAPWERSAITVLR